jgi:heat shock protein HslJ
MLTFLCIFRLHQNQPVMKSYLLLAVFTVFVLSCAQKPNGDHSNDNQSPSETDTTITSSETSGGSITEIRWKLIELTGKSATEYPAQNKEPYLLFKTDGTVEGTGGCNGTSGTYQVMGGGKIKFSQMISTKMACPDMTMEYADTYSSDGNTLILGKEGMPALAKFEAVQ